MWRLYTRSNRRGSIGRRPTFRYRTNAMAEPPGCQRATVQRVDNGVKLTGFCRERSIQEYGSNHVGEELLEDIQHTTPVAKVTLIQAIR